MLSFCLAQKLIFTVMSTWWKVNTHLSILQYTHTCAHSLQGYTDVSLYGVFCCCEECLFAVFSLLSYWASPKRDNNTSLWNKEHQMSPIKSYSLSFQLFGGLCRYIALLHVIIICKQCMYIIFRFIMSSSQAHTIFMATNARTRIIAICHHLSP